MPHLKNRRDPFLHLVSLPHFHRAGDFAQVTALQTLLVQVHTGLYKLQQVQARLVVVRVQPRPRETQQEQQGTTRTQARPPSCPGQVCLGKGLHLLAEVY